MKKIIFISATYYQMIMAMQMKQTVFKNEQVTLILTDDSNESKKIAKLLQKENFFHMVYHIKTSDLYPKTNSIFEFFRTGLALISGNHSSIDILKNNLNYDEMIYYNISPLAYIIFAAIKKNNKNLIASKYEEGILSYNRSQIEGMRGKILKTIRKFLRKDHLLDKTYNYYCYYPEVLDTKLNKITVPKIEINNIKFKNTLSNIFLNGKKNLSYPQKYVYFASIYDIDSKKSIDEIKLIKKIINIVGVKNLIVKVHPRDSIKRFQEQKLIVDNNSNAPWEVIQINGDFSKNVFLTSLSGSVLGINSVVKNPPKTYFLFPMCKLRNNELAIYFANEIEQTLEKSKKYNLLSNIKISKNLDFLDTKTLSLGDN